MGIPRGKLEEGETPEQGLARELREELDLPVRVGRISDAAPETEFHEFLILYYAAEMTGPQLVLKEHADCRFVSPEELTGTNFPPRIRWWPGKSPGEKSACNAQAHFLTDETQKLGFVILFGTKGALCVIISPWR